MEAKHDTGLEIANVRMAWLSSLGGHRNSGQLPDFRGAWVEAAGTTQHSVEVPCGRLGMPIWGTKACLSPFLLDMWLTNIVTRSRC